MFRFVAVITILVNLAIVMSLIQLTSRLPQNSNPPIVRERVQFGYVFFEVFDADKDGKLSQREIENIQCNIARLDYDNDTFISQEELAIYPLAIRIKQALCERIETLRAKMQNAGEQCCAPADNQS